MTTTPGMLPNPSFNWRRFVLVAMFLTFIAIVVASVVSLAPSSDGKPIDLYAGLDQVTCENARDASNQLSQAVEDLNRVPADYSKLEELGFPTPVSPTDLANLKETTKQRQAQINAISASVSDGTCDTTQPTAVVEVNGKKMTLPAVIGGDPEDPTLGSDATTDPNTLPVSIGSPGEATQENSWTDLDNAYNGTQWYKDCARKHLGINWNQDVPKFKQVEVELTRVILAINVSSTMTDDEIRQRLAPENPDVDLSKLQIIRMPAIINTRHLEDNRCDVFVQTRSELRISTGVPQFDTKGTFTATKHDRGILNGCDNFWKALTEGVKVNNPNPTSSKPPTTTNPPPTTTVPPGDCPPGQVWNGQKCVESKLAEDGAGARGNIPEQVQGPAPRPPATPEPKPAEPPATYVPPATTQPPTPPRTTVPPPPPSSEVTEPFDPCVENPAHPACG